MKKAIVFGVVILLFTVCSYAASEFSDVGLDTYGGTECNATDPFYDDTCPTCTLIITPRILIIRKIPRKIMKKPINLL